MDPGILIILSHICNVVAAVILGITIFGTADHAVHGGFNRDNTAMVSTFLKGSLATAIVYLCPFYAPSLLTGAIAVIRWF